MGQFKLIKNKIEQYLEDNLSYTPIDLAGDQYNNTDNKSYIRPDINISDVYGFIGGTKNTHKTGYLIISILVPFGSKTSSNIALEYADKIYDLFNYYEFLDDSLEFEESLLDDVGQVDNKLYQVNVTTNLLRESC